MGLALGFWLVDYSYNFALNIYMLFGISGIVEFSHNGYCFSFAIMLSYHHIIHQPSYDIPKHPQQRQPKCYTSRQAVLELTETKRHDRHGDTASVCCSK